ncbi:hypothetical protein CPLU01_13697 [Colletotrichum plurivorum]|uniref:Uncharacterized protein n=1 Tax=Colletotrichum plurivorum TaxID=2175906 RepID=A0A8H6JQV8_9PEZI|nr:hypothetical protein CPLU01_13697 [Colletotrichum plurivorum]
MQAFILPGLDVFQEGPQRAFIGRQNGPAWATSIIPQMPTSNQLSPEVYRKSHRSARKFRIPHDWRDMRIVERDLGRTFGELWKPYQERGLRIFVSRL